MYKYQNIRVMNQSTTDNKTDKEVQIIGKLFPSNSTFDYNYMLKNGVAVYGGAHCSDGLTISWQQGHPDVTGHKGAYVEDVISAAILRLDSYQGTEYACAENAKAIDLLHEALEVLNSRVRYAKMTESFKSYGGTVVLPVGSDEED